MVGLPPGVTQRPNGSLFRKITVSGPGGGQHDVIREVTLDPDEARARRIDYFHPQLGWVREGYKLERDRDTEAIMEDGSAGMATHEEDQSLKTVHQGAAAEGEPEAEATDTQEEAKEE